MNYVICLVALMLLSSSAYGAVQNWYVQANLTKAAPLFIRETALNVPVLSEGGLLVLNVTSNVPIAVCLKRTISPAADSTWWNTTCDYYGTYTPSTAAATADVQPTIQTNVISSRRTFRLKKMTIRDAAQGNLADAYLSQGFYYAGIFALDTSKLGTLYAPVTLTLSGDVCDAGMVGPNCQTAVVPVKNETLSVAFASNDFVYYTLTIPENTANVSVALSYNASSAAAADAATFSSFARQDNVPVAPGQFGNSKGAFQFAANSTKIVNSTMVGLALDITTPTPGTWYIAVVNNEASPVTAQVKFGNPVQCPAGFAGAACQFPVNSNLADSLASGALVSGTVNNGAWMFYSVPVPSTYSQLLVNVRSQDASVANPHVYLRANNVPTATDYLVKDCNVLPDDCVSVNKIQTYVATNGTWFIGVQGIADNQQFAIWLSTPCPASCSGHGTCTNATGVCSCSDYTGLDCATDNSSGGFKTVYIVLIVIGGVVLAGIIIGIIIYLRGRNAGYNPIR